MSPEGCTTIRNKFMQFKGTLILLVILLGLGSFVYFHDVRGSKDKKKAEETAKKVFQIDKNKIVEVDLVYPHEKITGVREGENKWRIVSPITAAGDGAEWERVASNFADLEKEKVLDSNPKDLDEYGLVKPVLRVSAKVNGGRTADVLFGSENPTNSYVYAKLSDRPDVLLVPSYYFTAIKKEVNDLRERSLLQFNEYDVNEFSLKNKHDTLQLSRTKDGWLIKSPVETKAEAREVNSILTAVSTGRVKTFLDTNPPNEKESGLTKPVIDFSVLEGKDRLKKQLIIGNKNGKQKEVAYYAKNDSRREIFLVDKEVFEKLDKTLFDLSDKSIASFKRWEIDAIQIAKPKDKLSLKKIKDEWTFEDNKQKARSEKINELLDALENEKVKAYLYKSQPLKNYGLEPPRVKIVLKHGNEEIVDLAFGNQAPRSAAKEAARYYAKDKSRKEVWLVEKKVLEAVQVKKEELIQPQ